LRKNQIILTTSLFTPSLLITIILLLLFEKS
jgi:hypothetical protein